MNHEFENYDKKHICFDDILKISDSTWIGINEFKEILNFKESIVYYKYWSHKSNIVIHNNDLIFKLIENDKDYVFINSGILTIDNNFIKDRCLLIIDKYKITKDIDFLIKIGILSFKQEQTNIKIEKHDRKAAIEEKQEELRNNYWDILIKEQNIKINNKNADYTSRRINEKKLKNMKDRRDKGYWI